MTEKNMKKERAKAQRVLWGMNLGTRTHKDAKHPSRADLKNQLRREA
jgi:hypothetical protein